MTSMEAAAERNRPSGGLLRCVPRLGLGAPVKWAAKARPAALARQDPLAVQQQQLLKLVRHAADTRFGRDHDFAGIRSIADFQARVPVRDHAGLWNDYWKEAFPRLENVSWPGVIPYFASSSGTTTGKVRYVPVSREMVKANKGAALDVMAHHLANRPHSRIMEGKTFLLGGSTALKEEAPGVFSGDMSGIASKERPWFAKPFYFPPLELSLMSDWEEKISRLAALSRHEDIRGLTGGPAWLLVLFEKLARLTPGNPQNVSQLYPNLELIVHGGMGLLPYKHRFDAWMAGSKADLREVFAASEGFVAAADRDYGMGMRLVVDHGLFFEFVPVEEIGSSNPTRHWLGTVETGVDYVLVLSNCAGFWAYDIGDIVRFVDLNPPRLLIVGRTAHTLSTFGEHIWAEQLEAVVTAAAESVGFPLKEFAVTAQVSRDGGALGHHLYFIEPLTPQPPERLAALLDAIDRGFTEANEDYMERRTVDGALQRPVLRTVPPGTFDAWMKSRGKFGGQHKVPRVFNDPSMQEGLLRIAGQIEPA